MMEFRAGKMVFDGKKVVPDLRKGLVRIGRVNCTSSSSSSSSLLVLHIVRAYVKTFVCLVKDNVFF